jgi:hypothetical protein
MLSDSVRVLAMFGIPSQDQIRKDSESRKPRNHEGHEELEEKLSSITAARSGGCPLANADSGH